jgi:hypothetical protein
MPTYKWTHRKFADIGGPGDCDAPEPEELTDDDDDRDPDEEAEAYEEWERDCYDPREDALAWSDQ